MLDGAVEPVILGHDIFGPYKGAFFSDVGRLAEFTFFSVRFTVFLFSGRGPIPHHLGRIDPGKRRNMAALTGHFIGMIVGLGIFFMGLAAVAGFAGDFGGQVVFNQTFAMLGGRCCIYPAGDIVQGGGVAADTIEVLAVDTHVNIEHLIGFY